MLHDPSHIPQIPAEQEIVLSGSEKDILRRLGAEIAAIASLPVHGEKARIWQKMNDLEQERAMVWINERYLFRYHSCKKSRSDAYQVHPLGFSDLVVGNRRGDN